MNEQDLDSVRFAIQTWEESGSAHLAFTFLPELDAVSYIELLPPSMRCELAELELVRDPPNSIDDFFVLQSSNVRAEFIAGLTEEQVLRKLRDEERKMKERDLRKFKALHTYFFNAA